MIFNISSQVKLKKQQRYRMRFLPTVPSIKKIHGFHIDISYMWQKLQLKSRGSSPAWGESKESNLL